MDWVWLETLEDLLCKVALPQSHARKLGRSPSKIAPHQASCWTCRLSAEKKKNKPQDLGSRNLMRNYFLDSVVRPLRLKPGLSSYNILHPHERFTRGTPGLNTSLISTNTHDKGQGHIPLGPYYSPPCSLKSEESCNCKS